MSTTLPRIENREERTIGGCSVAVSQLPSILMTEDTITSVVVLREGIIILCVSRRDSYRTASGGIDWGWKVGTETATATAELIRKMHRNVVNPTLDNPRCTCGPITPDSLPGHDIGCPRRLSR